MENNQNHEVREAPAAKGGAQGKSSGGRSSHGRGSRGGHHRSSRRPAAENNAENKENKGKDVSAQVQPREEGAPVQKEKNQSSSRSQQKSRSSSGNRKGKGKNGGNGAGAREQTTEQTKQPSAEGGKRRAQRNSGRIEEVSTANLFSPGVFDGIDRLQGDSFLPIHEEHLPDPEAEAYAASVLDAEGSLLAATAEQPVEKAPESEDTAEAEELVEIVGIRFRMTGKVYFFDPGALKLRAGSHAVVETARGLEYGEVYRGNTRVPASQIVPPLRTVIRAATKEDDRHFEENKAREQEAFRVCQEKIAAHELDMKLVEAEYTFDNTKLLFYFTSAGRVDFRELVKDLAGVFRTRIELRQIGIRDEAKLLGGLGTCGRPLCCASFLADFVQVSIKMAKEQNLSLNSTKISGCCGRLMCCLRYEADTYEEEIRRTPSQGSLLKTPDGQGTVVSNNPLRGTVRVRLNDENNTVKEYHRDVVQVIKATETADQE